MTHTAVIEVNLRKDYHIAGLVLPTDTAAYTEAMDVNDKEACTRIESAREDMLAAALAQFTAGARAEGKRLGLGVAILAEPLVYGGDDLGDSEDADETRGFIWQAGQDAITARADAVGGWAA